MKKIFLLLLPAFLTFAINGAEHETTLSHVATPNEEASANTEKTIQVSHPGGTLAAYFSEDEKRNVSKLTITGTLDQSDWEFLQGMMQGENNLRFLDLSGLTNQAVSSAVGQYFFKDTRKIDEVLLPAKLTTMQVGFFQGSSITKCDLPSTLTSMSAYIFHESNLSGKVVIPSGIKVLNFGSFYKTNITEVLLNEGLTTIRNMAFSGTKLTEVTLPSTLEEIGLNAFQSESIKKVYSKNPTPPAPLDDKTRTFGFEKVEYIGVPIGSEDAYKKSPVWEKYAKVIVGVDFNNLGL